MYDKTFDGLETLADGRYLLQYTDGFNSKTIVLNKQTTPIAKMKMQADVLARK